MTQKRDATAGVTLIEMLVVLALFALVASAVALSLPSGRGNTSVEAGARALRAHLEHALDAALTTGSGFGLLHDGSDLRFVQRDPSGEWKSHGNKQLADVKLSLPPSRITINPQEVFAVSARLIPSRSVPFKVQFGAGERSQFVVFDGARVVRQDGP
ncbi:prepilin-type N-terminal cleavage/methylation domain-containing protein [Tateyamaria armeniaca]|uniref:Prepilin-type N-terminal cleavage/methylation domain-containing protein n=1 Tax=Tateyamaria armeniaca TaxID=2518930 RepID=A0ABW8UYA8_9RHOB